ncbi:MAG: AAA family ATPase [Patescibacteria group bacterium]
MNLLPVIDYVSKQMKETSGILRSKTRNSLGKVYPTRTIFIKIQQYVLQHLSISKIGDVRWVVVPGLRGVGKSTLLAQVYNQIIKSHDVEFIYFSLDEVVNSLGSNLHEVLNAYEKVADISLATHRKKIFLFLDEVHYDENWASVVKVLFDKNPNIFIFATGSSAVALQRNADEQRRLKVEPLYPMSFAEYMVVKHGVWPIKDLKKRVTEAIFFQDNASDIYARLKGVEGLVEQYWGKVPSNALSDYMFVGSIPFATVYEDKTQAFDAIYQTVRAIVEVDLPQLGNFKKTTAPYILQILSVLAISSGISTNKLASNLNIRHETVSDILVALVKAELVVEVQPYGSVKNKAKKPKKYLFMSPAIRASILFAVGGEDLIEKHKGELLEDVVGMYLYREMTAKHRGIISYYEKGHDLHVDFVVSVGGKDIPLEVGMGKKDTKQLWGIMDRLNSPYGLICHSRGLEIYDERVVKVPHDFFLLV